MTIFSIDYNIHITKMTKRKHGDDDESETIIDEQELWKRYYFNLIKQRRKRIDKMINSEEEERIEKGKQALTEYETWKTKLSQQCDEFIELIKNSESSSSNNNPVDTTNENLQQFSVLPEDTILYIMKFYQFPLYKYLFELDNVNNTSLRPKIIHSWLLKKLFGYYSTNRSIIALFPCINFSRRNTRIYFESVDDMYNTKTIVNALLRIKGVVSLNIADWIDESNYIDICSPQSRVKYNYPYGFRSDIRLTVTSTIDKDDSHTINLGSHDSTMSLYGNVDDKFDLDQRSFKLMWKDDLSVVPMSSSILVRKEFAKHPNSELLLELTGDITFDHLERLVTKDIDCRGFLNRCPNLTRLHVSRVEDCRNLTNLRVLQCSSLVLNSKTMLNQLKKLEELDCKYTYELDQVNAVALLPQLKRLTMNMYAGDSCNFNPNLVHLNLMTRVLQSQCVIDILNMKSLKQLSLSYLPMDELALPYFASNKTITDLKLTLEPHTFYPQAMQHIVQNQTIRKLNVATDQLFIMEHNLFPQLESLNTKISNDGNIDKLIHQAVNLTSLSLSSVYNNEKKDKTYIQRVLLELPKLSSFELSLTIGDDNSDVTNAFMKTKVEHLSLYTHFNPILIMHLRANPHIKSLKTGKNTVSKEGIVSLLSMKSLHTLQLKCDYGIEEGDLIPYVERNRNLKSLELHSVTRDSDDINDMILYEAGSHIPHFVVTLFIL
jgi:hypothetical protein